MSKRELEEGYLLPAKNGERVMTDLEVQFSDEDSDDFESDDEEIFQQSGDEEGDGDVMVIDEPRTQVWLPGTQLARDEVLEPDMSAYEYLHKFDVKWPCLTLDILWDNMGDGRVFYPLTCYIVTGTQADEAKRNELQIIKCDNLVKTQVEDDESISSVGSKDEEPKLSYRAIPVPGGTNRIRSTQQRDKPRLVASMNENNSVYIHNIEPHLRSIDDSEESGSILKDTSLNRPLHTIKSHADEGFALDWSPTTYGKLITGDNNGKIYLTTRNDDGSFTTDPKPFKGHEGPVEDLQWSPKEKTVFASCSSDGTIRIWSTRSKARTPSITVKAHEVDVNVISWNPSVDYLIASGSDNGQISIWDLRTFPKQTPESPVQPVATFNHHKQAITSIQWHPTDESVLVASGADDQVTIWDLSVELDAEEQAAKQAEGLGEVPDQLMFVHMGQEHIKEARWHKQNPGMVITTALNFNVFKSAHQS